MIVVAAVGSADTRNDRHAVKWSMLNNVGNLTALVLKRRFQVMNNHENISFLLHNSGFGNRDNELAAFFPVLSKISNDFIGKVPCQKQGIIGAALDKCRIG